jgi:predicted amidohydrolase
LTLVRIALANIPLASTREESVELARRAIGDAAQAGASIVCFPEVFIPGYRTSDRPAPAPDGRFLETAWSTLADAARDAKITVVVGTERIVVGAPRISTLVINADGTRAGFQDKVQLDPTEESIYSPGDARHMFDAGPLRFGVSICHEGFRYPETVRWHARRGAHVVFHPHFYRAEGDSFRPENFADPRNSFHEKAIVCRAAENTCYVASVNYASAGSPTTSFVVRPDGSVQAWQPYGLAGLLVADIDTSAATGLLANRLRED